MLRATLLLSTADELLVECEELAHKANGEVDKDGIDDFIGVVVQKFAAELRAAMEAKNKEE